MNIKEYIKSIINPDKQYGLTPKIHGPDPGTGIKIRVHYTGKTHSNNKIATDIPSIRSDFKPSTGLLAIPDIYQDEFVRKILKGAFDIFEDSTYHTEKNITIKKFLGKNIENKTLEEYFESEEYKKDRYQRNGKCFFNPGEYYTDEQIVLNNVTSWPIAFVNTNNYAILLRQPLTMAIKLNAPPKHAPLLKKSETILKPVFLISAYEKILGLNGEEKFAESILPRTNTPRTHDWESMSNLTLNYGLNSLQFDVVPIDAKY